METFEKLPPALLDITSASVSPSPKIRFLNLVPSPEAAPTVKSRARKTGNKGRGRENAGACVRFREKRKRINEPKSTTA